MARLAKRRNQDRRDLDFGDLLIKTHFAFINVRMVGHPEICRIFTSGWFRMFRIAGNFRNAALRFPVSQSAKNRENSNPRHREIEQQAKDEGKSQLRKAVSGANESKSDGSRPIHYILNFGPCAIGTEERISHYS